MVSDTVEPYWKAAKATTAGWIVGLLAGIGCLWFLLTTGNTVLQAMFGFVAVVALAYAANLTRNRATARRLQNSSEY